MGRGCAVPKCKTGYKSVKEKCSLFTVPKNIEQYKKWQAAIPGVRLKHSHCVCEKHFEKKYILKEWIKRDSEGRIIAQVPYLHARLVELAVPTIFDSSAAVNPLVLRVVNQPMDGVHGASKFLKSPCGNSGAHLLGVVDAESVHTSYEKTRDFIQNPDVLPHEIVDIDVSSKQEKIPAEISSPCEFLEFDVKSLLKSTQSEMFSSHDFVQHDVPSRQGFIQPDTLPQQQFNEPEFQSPHELVEQKVRLPREFVQHEILPPTEVDIIASTFDNCVGAGSASTVCAKNFHISRIAIDDCSSDATTSEKKPIAIPMSWAVTEYTEGGGQSVLFSNIVKTRVNGTAGPIIDKSIEVKTDKTLRYSVYGRVVNSERCQLSPVLTDTSLLPKTLETFKNLNVCNGLGNVNIHYLSFDGVFQDCVQRWRDNDCTMISKRKRCEYCKTMRQRILQRESRSKKTETFHRIRQVSNPIDKRKLIALRKKNSRERRVKNYSKRRVQLLTQSFNYAHSGSK